MNPLGFPLSDFAPYLFDVLGARLQRLGPLAFRVSSVRYPLVCVSAAVYSLSILKEVFRFGFILDF